MVDIEDVVNWYKPRTQNTIDCKSFRQATMKKFLFKIFFCLLSFLYVLNSHIIIIYQVILDGCPAVSLFHVKYFLEHDLFSWNILSSPYSFLDYNNFDIFLYLNVYRLKNDERNVKIFWRYIRNKLKALWRSWFV